MNEIFPLERASEAYDRMMSGKARFRVVLTAKVFVVRAGKQIQQTTKKHQESGIAGRS